MISFLAPKISPDEKIAIALSGGADSMALAIYAKQRFSHLTALTFDHHLRPESSLEALQIAEWMQKYSITHHILEWANPQASMEQAREARYQAMSKWCVDNQHKYLMVAHHMQDQAETFLINLERGSGVDGLAAMPYMVKFGDIYILRPFLNNQKSLLQEFLCSIGQEWIEDPTNQNLKYQRNAIRNKLNGSEEYIRRIFLAANNMGRVRNLLERQTNKAMDEIVHLGAEGYYMIPHQDYLLLDEEIALRMLKSCLISISGAVNKIRFDDITKLHQHMLMENFKARTLGNCKIRYFKGKIFIYREFSKITGYHEGYWDFRFQTNDVNLRRITKEELKLIRPDKSIPKEIYLTMPINYLQQKFSPKIPLKKEPFYFN